MEKGKGMKEEVRDKVVGVRLTPEYHQKLLEKSKKIFLTPSKIGQVLIEKFLRGEIDIFEK